MSVHHRFISRLALSVCLILSLSVNLASADSQKCSAEAGAIKGFTLHEMPKPMSEDGFVTMTGAEKRLADFKGKAVLLNHWAIWCAPCIREMPSIMRLSQEVSSETIAVVPLSMDRTGYKKVAQFVAKKKWTGADFYNDKKMAIARGSSLVGIPATQVLDKNGQEIGRLVGTYEWDEPEVVALLTCLAQ